MRSKVIIMRGVSGAGKSTYVAQIEGASVVSADHYQVDRQGRYRFDPRRVGLSHKLCFVRFAKLCAAAASGRGPAAIVVDNTSVRRSDVSKYVVTARSYGLEVEVVALLVDPDIAADRNVHGVSREKVLEMDRTLRAELELDIDGVDQKVVQV